jgi:histidinol-phosphate aminotransferase
VDDRRPTPLDRLGAIPSYRAGRRAPFGAYKLSSNENPFPPAPGVTAAIAAAAAEANRYPDPASCRLVAALASHHGVAEPQIAVGTGSVAVLQHVCSAYAGAGDEIVYAWRAFEAYPIVTTVAGATGVPVPLRPDWRHDVEAMVDAVTERTRVLLLCTPNNPTGTSVTTSELADLLDAVPPHVVVVLDEAYAEFVRSAGAASGLPMLAAFPNVVVLRTFSKAYGLAGLRVGYGIGAEAVMAPVRKAATPFGVSDLAQSAALAALAAHLDVTMQVEVVVAERRRMSDALLATGWLLPPSDGNFVWVPTGDHTDEIATALELAGVVVRSFSGEGIRITVGPPPANDVVLDVLGALVR